MSQTYDVLHVREAEWAPALRAVSLVAEIGAAEDRVKEVISALGRLYWLADHNDRARLLTRQFPACLVTAMAGIGAVGYEAGDYWSAVRRAAGVPLVQMHQTLWGRFFRDGLDRFHLARFPGLPQVNVGEILMHAGIPTYCLGDLLDLLLRRQSRDPGLSAEDFISWAAAPGRESRLFEVDVPVRRLIRYGGDYAEDLIDRCVDLLDRLRQPVFDADGLGLPPHLVARARELAEAGFLAWSGNSGRMATEARDVRARPRLELEPFGRGLLVWLPPVADAPDGRAEWRLRADGEVESVVSRSLWPGSSETAPAAMVPLPRPVRQLTVELAGYDQEYELRIVDSQDPLLVFTEDGRRIPTTSGIAPGPVWLLYPLEGVGGESLELRVDGPVLEAYDVPSPYGWLGWTLRRADLSQASVLQLSDGTKRWVKGARRAQLGLSPPLPGVRSLDDSPIVTAPPLLTLPTDLGATTDWSVRVRHPRSGQVLSAENLAITDDATIDPWRRLARPLVGPYEIVVRGPLGQGLSRIVEFVEGLRVASNPSWRGIRADGLEPAVVRASSRLHGLSVEPQEVRLGTRDSAAEFQIRSSSSAPTTVQVTPSHMAVQRLGSGTHPAWSLQPLRLDTETIDEGELLVRLPLPVDTQLVVRVGTNEMQTVESAAAYGQPLARFNLGAIADTVRESGSAQLEVRLDGQYFPVARCTPRRLARAVRIDEDRLVLVEGVRTEGLVAGLYPVFSPWKPPHVVRINTDLVSDPLPPEVAASGPLVAMLRVDDPWLPVDWPEWPSSGNTFPVVGLLWKPAGQDAAADALSGYLAGVGDLPDRPDAVPLLFKLYARADDVGSQGVAVDVRGLAASILGRHPSPALKALTKIQTSADQVVAPLVHSGLVASPCARYVSESDEERLWAASPLAGMIASAYQLNDIASKVELCEQLNAACGDVSSHLLAGNADPYAGVGRFDESAEMFAQLPVQQRDRAWKAMRVVPGGLLDADERTVAARQLFEVRDRPGVRRVAEHAERLLVSLRGPLDEAGGPVVTSALHARRPSRGWLALPALSLALAFVARLAARGHASLEHQHRRTLPYHAKLARAAPRLVTIDLLLAEFTLTGSGAAR